MTLGKVDMVPTTKSICVLLFGFAVFTTVASLGSYLMSEVPPITSGKRPMPLEGLKLQVPKALQSATIVYMGGCGGCQKDPVEWSRIRSRVNNNLYFLYDGHPAAFSELPKSKQFLFSHSSPDLRVLTNSWYPRAFTLKDGTVTSIQRSPDDETIIRVVPK